MGKRVGLLALVAAVGFAPNHADAQRFGRTGTTVNTPYGQFSMDEMRAAGNDPSVARQWQDQKLMLMQQQQMMKMQQQYMQRMAKQAKSGGTAKGATPAPLVAPRTAAKAKAKKKAAATPVVEEKDPGGAAAPVPAPGSAAERSAAKKAK